MVEPPVADTAHAPSPPASAERIAARLIQAIQGGRLTPGARIGEEELGSVFAVSRTVVREALTLLASQGIVVVRPRKGWFVVEPTEREVREVFATRRLIEGALARDFARNASPERLRALKAHLREQHTAIAADDAARRTHLLGDFHVQIAATSGNELLTRMVRDLTTRTTLISLLYQTELEAAESAHEHDKFVAAIEAGNAEQAGRIMEAHLRNVEAGLQQRKANDRVSLLRATLDWESPAPVSAAPERASPRPPRRRRRAR